MRIFWDVDGTLVANEPNSVDLYAEAVRSVIRDSRPFRAPSRHGKTDRQIVNEYVELAGGHAREADAVSARLETLSKVKYLSPEGARAPLPGAIVAVRELFRLGHVNALLTGNSRERAEYKLSGAGFASEDFDWAVSEFGGEFGSRPEMARALAAKSGWGVVIGDTPEDGAAAALIGFPFVAVTTGIFGRKSLRHLNPLALIGDLEEDLDVLLSAVARLDAQHRCP